MTRKAIRMQLYPGYENEYKKRHDELWPEMRNMLKDHGVINYAIFLDKETNALFGYLEIEDEDKWAQSAYTEINQKWWNHMADIMETNEDHSPKTVNLVEVFNFN
ncbi:L-rhamnose mutarotase [Tetragenococcus halophilus]|uniref:L-rhamnose mutarotase n=1 Tax=Tetragenococcus halophilus TaxID=51669 RepID=UPI0015BCD046|nr:L-rhamnose mutarotase [Tetragenococcus halophilus]NWO00516.1 L-rhamnose mutarotase [Tetragenococcus halophilus]